MTTAEQIENRANLAWHSVERNILDAAHTLIEQGQAAALQEFAATAKKLSGDTHERHTTSLLPRNFYKDLQNAISQNPAIAKAFSSPINRATKIRHTLTPHEGTQLTRREMLAAGATAVAGVGALTAFFTAPTSQKYVDAKQTLDALPDEVKSHVQKFNGGSKYHEFADALEQIRNAQLNNVPIASEEAQQQLDIEIAKIREAADAKTTLNDKDYKEVFFAAPILIVVAIAAGLLIENAGRDYAERQNTALRLIDVLAEKLPGVCPAEQAVG